MVHIDVHSPARFERTQLLLRILLACALGWAGLTVGWISCVLYALLPLVAALVISADGRDRYTGVVGPRIWRGLDWLLQLSAYMLLVVDRFPSGGERDVTIQLEITGRPTVRSSLLRLVTSLPSAVVLALVSIVSWMLWIVGATYALFVRRIPAPILAFQRGVLQWQVRLTAYHASLIDEYPPFSFDADVHHDATLHARSL